MKKAIAIILAILIVWSFASVGCASASQGEEKSSFGFFNPDLIETSTSGSIYFWTDDETGVQYIIFKGDRKAGITPRLNADGTLYTE